MGLDGNSTHPKFIDWSARTHDTVYLVAGNYSGNKTYGTDNYNGITVAMTTKSGVQYWDKVDQRNESDSDEGGRHLTALLAPGVGVKSANPNAETFDVVDGTSYAAPHVTGTIALLQEYAEGMLSIVPVPQHWDRTSVIDGVTYNNPQRHEVMKAVVMNAADKIDSQGDPKKLMQTRWVYRKDGTTTWLTSTGHDEFHPLDDQLGVGHLNARRAVDQYQNGEWDPLEDAPSLAWDFHATPGTGTFNRYELADMIQAGSYISVTLVWDRRVVDNNGHYTAGEPLTNQGFPDLDLFVVPRGGNEGNAVARSISLIYNVEHIFKIVAVEGKYDILVKQVDAGPTGSQHYAIAWWAFGVPDHIPGGEGITLETAAYARGSDGGSGGEGPSLFASRIAEGLFEAKENLDLQTIDVPTRTPSHGPPFAGAPVLFDEPLSKSFFSGNGPSNVNPWDEFTIDGLLGLAPFAFAGE